MRKVFLLALATLAVLVAALPGSVIPATTASQGTSQYVVLYKLSATKAAAHAAITAAGGTIVRENTRVGLATVRSSNSDFIAAAMSKAAIKGAAHSLRIGSVPKAFRQSGQVDKFAFEKGDFSGESTGAAASSAAAAVDETGLRRQAGFIDQRRHHHSTQRRRPVERAIEKRRRRIDERAHHQLLNRAGGS